MADWNEQIVAEFRENDGTVETMGFGRTLVLVHHVGAKSGTERVTPLRAIPVGDHTWLVAASKGGAPDNPDWYYNLLANPDASIETPDAGTIEVRAEALQGDARDAAWKRFTEASDAFAGYEQKTTRTIPVIALTRR